LGTGAEVTKVAPITSATQQFNLSLDVVVIPQRGI